MPVEAVPVEFQGNQSVKKAAESINQVLQKGEYIGHILVTGDSSRYMGAARVEGVVMLMNVTDKAE